MNGATRNGSARGAHRSPRRGGVGARRCPGAPPRVVPRHHRRRTVDGDSRVITTRQRPADARGDRHHRPDPAPVPVPDHRADRSSSTSAPSTCSTSATAPCLVVYSTDADPATMALDHRRAPPATPLEHLRDARWKDEPDGPQDPVRHHRPAALRHARLQRRHARPHAGRRRPRRARASATSARIPQSVVCMPSRSTMLTGQHPTHARRVDERRAAARRRARRSPPCCTTPATARRSIGKAHFEPFLDPFRRFTENALGAPDDPAAPAAPHRGFEHLEFATHGAVGPAALRAVARGRTTPRRSAMLLRGARPRPAGQRRGRRRHRRAAGARQPDRRATGTTPTGWPTARSRWLDSLDADDDWFCWMSFPDPHHPWDPPQSEMGRIDWRDVPLPAGYPADAGRARARSSTPSRATGGSGTTARSCRTTRRRATGCRRR